METMREMYIDKLAYRYMSDWNLSSKEARDFARIKINALEEFMARNEMSLYADKALAHPDVIKRIWGFDNSKEDWEELKETVRFGYPYTAFDDRAGYIQVKLDFTRDTIKKIK